MKKTLINRLPTLIWLACAAAAAGALLASLTT
jgi:hypothetical protein